MQLVNFSRWFVQMISRGTCSEVLWIMKVTVEVTVP